MTRSDSLRPPLFAVVCAGLVSGTLDLIYACSFHATVNNMSPVRLLQAIASGIQGTAAFDGGYPSAALGFAAHYVILIVAAGMYWAASRRLRFLTDHAFVAGVLYGMAIWLTMRYVILPLSAAPPFKGSTLGFVTNLLAHLLLVGPGIALTLRRLAR